MIFLKFFQDALKEQIDKQIIINVCVHDVPMVNKVFSESKIYKGEDGEVTVSKLDAEFERIRKIYGVQVEPIIKPFWWAE